MQRAEAGARPNGEGPKAEVKEAPPQILRHAFEIWPVGLRFAMQNLGAIIIFVVAAMLFSGGVHRMDAGGSVGGLMILWVCGLYVGALVFVAAVRASITSLATSGDAKDTVTDPSGAAAAGAFGTSGVLHWVALWSAMIAIAGWLLAMILLELATSPSVAPASEGVSGFAAYLARHLALIRDAGPFAAGAALAAGFCVAALVFGRGAARIAMKGVGATPRRSGGWVRLSAAFLISAAPLAALAWLGDLVRPDATQAGGYWTLDHAIGELGVFIAAALALTFAGVALADATPPPRGAMHARSA